MMDYLIFVLFVLSVIGIVFLPAYLLETAIQKIHNDYIDEMSGYWGGFEKPEKREDE
jgi:hypothetical protein